MVNGGLSGPPGRREQHVTRALSASAVLPTFSFATLGTVTVLGVALMGMAPMGSLLGPSARDAAMTTPRMTVSMAPPFVQRSAPDTDRVAAHPVAAPKVITAAVVDVPPQPKRLAIAASDLSVASRTIVAAPAVAPTPVTAPAVAPTPVTAPARVEDSQARAQSSESAARSTDVAHPSSRVSEFTREKMLVGDDRSENGSQRASNQREAAKTAKDEKASTACKTSTAGMTSEANKTSKTGKTSEANKGSKALNVSRADSATYAFKAHRHSWSI
jgi:hypothetical protein